MRPTVSMAAVSMRNVWRLLGGRAALWAAMWLTLAGPPLALAQDMGSDHDAGDEEMLTGQPSTGNRPGQRPGMPGEPAPLAELSYVTRLDKTAVWVGDQFHYQIIVDHSPMIQFVLENLSPENINMEPLRVMAATNQSYPLKNGNTRLFVDLTLTNYATGIAQLQIPQLNLFYFRREGAAASATSGEGEAAQSLTVDGPMIGVRSTLPPQPEDLRDAVTVTGWADNRWVVAGVGWMALIVLVIGVGWEGAHMIRYRRGRKGPDPRKAMASIQDRWARSVPGDFSDPSVVMDFYGRSYQDVKEFLGYALDTHTEGLTADDMRDEMVRLAANSDLTERTSKVLSTCELARYGRNGTGLTDDAARGIAHDVREIFDAGRRLH